MTLSYMLQFEPERFADGLLGIGAAGGTSSTNEGAVLAARLEVLRKERSERAETLEGKNVETIPAIDTGSIDRAVVETTPAYPSSSKNRNKSKNKKNKRKR